MYKNKNNVWIYVFSNRKYHRNSSLNHFIAIFYHLLAMYWCGFSAEIKQINPTKKVIVIPSFKLSSICVNDNVENLLSKFYKVHYAETMQKAPETRKWLYPKSFQEPSRPVTFAAAVVTLRTQEGFPNLKCFLCLWGTGSVCIFYWRTLPEKPPSVKTNFHFRAANVSLTFKWRK